MRGSEIDNEMSTRPEAQGLGGFVHLNCLPLTAGAIRVSIDFYAPGPVTSEPQNMCARSRGAVARFCAVPSGISSGDLSGRTRSQPVPAGSQAGLLVADLSQHFCVFVAVWISSGMSSSPLVADPSRN